jgi:hypothetical protein
MTDQLNYLIDEAISALEKNNLDAAWHFLRRAKTFANNPKQWVGLEEVDFSAINQSCLTKLQAATCAESILKEKNK